jgi:DNA-binding NtrC family response regulator
MIIQAVILAEDSEITCDLLKPSLDDTSTTDQDQLQLRVGTTLEEAEKELIRLTLSKVSGQKSEAAKILGISRKGFYNKLKKHGI